MNKTMKMMSVLCGAAIFTGCASTNQGMVMKVVPATKISHSEESAEGYYSLGRYHHAASRFDEAVKAYERTIQLDARHAKARNALGVLYAERGKYAQAIQVLRQAIVVEPNNSYLHSNLGYACYLNGNYSDAAASLEQATQLDPNNVRAWNNLDSVMEKLGRPVESKVIYKKVQPIKEGFLTRSNGKEVPAIMSARTGEAAVQSASGSISRADFRMRSEPVVRARTALRQVGQNLYELEQFGQKSDAGKIAASVSRPVDVPQPVPGGVSGTTEDSLRPRSSSVRLEISNGNGVTGMAKSVGKLIGGGPLRVVRLTNQLPFNVKTTRIEYSDGHENTARALAASLGREINVIPKRGTASLDIRVVLGHDLRDGELLRAHFFNQLKVTKAASEIDACETDLCLG
jgi:tetratricopeptide (TPR) repeat protein